MALFCGEKSRDEVRVVEVPGGEPGAGAEGTQHSGTPARRGSSPSSREGGVASGVREESKAAHRPREYLGRLASPCQRSWDAIDPPD